MDITNEELKEFKDRMRLEDNVEDENLTRILSASFFSLKIA